MNFSDDDLLGLWRALSSSLDHLEDFLANCHQPRINDELLSYRRLQDQVMAEMVKRKLDVCRTPEWNKIFGGKA